MGRENPFWTDYLTPAGLSQDSGANTADIANSTSQSPTENAQLPGSMPTYYAPNQQPAGMPSNYVPNQQPVGMPSNYVPNQQPAGMPSNYAPNQQPAGMPSNYVPNQQPVVMPQNYVPAQQPTVTPQNYANVDFSSYGSTPSDGNNGPKKDKVAYTILFVLLGLVVVLVLVAVAFFVKGRRDASDSLSATNSTDTDIDTDADVDSDANVTSGTSQSGNNNLPTDDELDEMLKGTQAESEEYYSFDNYLVDDLDYKISFETYEYVSDDERNKVYIQYPVFEGDDVPNSGAIANAVRIEPDYWIDFFENTYLAQVDGPDTKFQLYIKPYVTYMSDEVLSIVYSENIQTMDYSSVNLVSVNIDMVTGFKMQNNKIIAPNLAFAQDLIDRSYVQNGSSAFDSLGAEGVLQLLEDENAIIIFYTPLGLEVGANHNYGWTTVTYIEYEQYLNSF